MGNRWGYPTRQNIVVEPVSKLPTEVIHADSAVSFDEIPVPREEPEKGPFFTATVPVPEIVSPITEEAKEEVITQEEPSVKSVGTTTEDITTAVEAAVAALHIEEEKQADPPGQVNEEVSQEQPKEDTNAPPLPPKSGKKKRYRYYKK